MGPVLVNHHTPPFGGPPGLSNDQHMIPPFHGEAGLGMLTRIRCKHSREASSQSHVGSNFIVLYFLKYKLDHF